MWLIICHDSFNQGMVIFDILNIARFVARISEKQIVQTVAFSSETSCLVIKPVVTTKMSHPLNKSVTLHNGVEMPLLGFGTYRLKKEAVQDPVRFALEAGYRHIDTASVYRNEQFIAKIINDDNETIENNSKVKREDIFITTKLAPKHHGYEKASAAIDESIKNLGTSPIDLFLIHWPGVSGMKPDDPETPLMRLETWRALENALDDGKVRSIGVSNFQPRHLKHLIENCRIKPHVNQFEFHPACQQTELIELCNKHKIQIVAYSSLGVGELLSHPEVIKLSSRCERSEAQVLLRWAMQKGVCVIPKASSKERIEENSKLFDFDLKKDDMKALDDISKEFPEGHHFCWNPESVLY